MAMNTVAPGIYSEVRDLSAFVDLQPSTNALIAMICEQGPDNTLTRVTRSSFYTLFGNPNINYLNNAQYAMGPYVASSFLEESNNLFVIRCLPDDAAYANLFITCPEALVDSSSGIPTSAQDITSCDATSYAGGNGANTIQELSDKLAVNIDDTGDGYKLVAFRGIGRGEFYNNFQVDLNKHAFNTGDDRPDLYILDVYKKQTYSSRFSTSNLSDENYVDYTIVETFDVSFDPGSKDAAGQSNYIEDVVNTYSNYIRCECATEVLKEMARRYNLDDTGVRLSIDFSTGFIRSHTELQTSSWGEVSVGYGKDLENGSSGTLFTVTGLDSSVATQILSLAYEGQLLMPDYTSAENVVENRVIDTENYSFDLVLDAGYPASVKTSIVGLANTRRDCVAIVDNGDNKTASEAIIDRTGSHAWNTPYAALYEPYTKVYDPFTGKNLWMPPSYHVSKAIAFNDKTTEVWYAPAGFNRAAIQNIVEMRYNANIGDRENFIKKQINPIVKFAEGYSIFSQRTTLTKATARQDLNVVRLILFIDKALKEFCRQFIFELNNNDTWNQISQEVNRFLREVKSRRGLDSFSVSVGATDYDKKVRRVYVNITLQPTRVIEQIHLSYFVQ